MLLTANAPPQSVIFHHHTLKGLTGWEPVALPLIVYVLARACSQTMIKAIVPTY